MNVILEKVIVPGYIIVLLLVISINISCSSQKLNSQSTGPEKNAVKRKSYNPDPEVWHELVFKDSTFVETPVDDDPVRTAANEKICLAILQEMEYPVRARENGIQGLVLITLVVNESGQLEDAFIAKGVGGGCEEEALRAVNHIGQNGFVPARVAGIPVKVKYDLPLRFSLD